MPRRYELLNSINVQGGINASAPKFTPESLASLDSDGTWNAIVSGDHYIRPIRGFTSQGANTGSRKMLTIGKKWGGIKDNGGTQGSGNFLESIGRSYWGIGAGLPHLEGTNIPGWVLSSNLQVSIPINGVYTTPIDAGLAQPSAPEVGLIAGLPGDLNSSTSVKIERRRTSTGARSVASPTSAVIVGSNSRFRVTFPLAATGQTHWRVYVPLQGFGGIGVHFLIAFNGNVTDIPESTVAAGVIDGIARSLEFNYKDGDLIPIEASFDDFPPPAATHCSQLQNIMALVGAFSDSTAAPSSTSPGTAIAISKQNNFESYIPTHLLYLPEQVIDVLARPIDDFAYVACENSIHAIQYIGDRGDELPPATITTILPDIGIQFPHNWTHFRGQLLIYAAPGNLIWMNASGEFDTAFAAPITKILQNFNMAGTVLGYDPRNDCLIVGNGPRLLIYSIPSGKWRQAWLPDFDVIGAGEGLPVLVSAATAIRRLYLSVQGAQLNTFSFDEGTANFLYSVETSLQHAPGGMGIVKDIYETAISGESGAVNAGGSSTASIVVARNDMPFSSYRQTGIKQSVPNTITNDNNNFHPLMLGKKFVIRIKNGFGVPFFFAGIITAVAPNSISVTDLQGGAFLPESDQQHLLLQVGDFAALSNQSGIALRNVFPNMAEARAYKVMFMAEGQNDVGNLYTIDIFGAAYTSSRAK